MLLFNQYESSFEDSYWLRGGEGGGEGGEGGPSLWIEELIADHKLQHGVGWL